jgi:hypothetical protein
MDLYERIMDAVGFIKKHFLPVPQVGAYPVTPAGWCWARPAP